MIARGTLITSLLVLASVGSGASAEERPDAGACARIENDAKRLACYDALFRTTPQERFGAQAPVVKEEIPELRARVTAVARRSRGEYEFTLDNGQVWVQTEVKPQLTLSAGSEVVIRKASMGSYRLQRAGLKTSTTVVRVR
jgi:hypothetical protein